MITAYRPPFAPLQPSNLRFQSGPPSPASPLIPQCVTNQSPPRKFTDAESCGMTTSDSAPPRPISWLWFCHLCRFSYPLGATRRCLNDGHVVCVGKTVSKSGRIKRHQMCHTEFDFVGWEVWGRWRRNKHRNPPVSTHRGNNCSTQCDFPSQCRNKSRRIVSDDEVGQHNACPWATEEPESQSSTLHSPLKPPGLNFEKYVPTAETLPPKLSPIQEDTLESTTPPTLGVSSNNSGLAIIVPDFATFMTRCAPVAPPARPIQNPSTAHVSKGEMSPTSPRALMAALIRPFGFGYNNDPPPVGFEDPVSPESPPGSFWDGNAGDVGSTVSSNQTFDDILKGANIVS